MSTYVREIISATVYYSQKEKYIYGSSRLGVMNDSLPLYGSQNATYSQTTWTHGIGKRNYELANHLGNVLSVISDKVIAHGSGVFTGTPSLEVVDYFMSDIFQSSDYSAFGVQPSGRNLYKTGIGKQFRFGYQGSEQDDEIKGDGNSYTTEFRQLDPRLGRWLSIDPVIQPWQSPYCSMDNNPIWFNDPKGDRIIKQEKGEARRRFNRMNREAKRQDKDYRKWWRSKRFDGKDNYISFVNDANGTLTPTQFTSPKYLSSRKGTSPYPGNLVTIGPGGTESAGTSMGDEQGHYYFCELLRNETEINTEKTGNPIATASFPRTPGLKYDKTTETYKAKMKLEENNFILNSRINPACPTFANGTVVNFNITDGKGNPVANYNLTDDGSWGNGAQSGPMNLFTADKVLKITVTVLNPYFPMSPYTVWQVKTTTTKFSVSDEWHFDLRRLFRRESLVNL